MRRLMFVALATLGGVLLAGFGLARLAWKPVDWTRVPGGSR